MYEPPYAITDPILSAVAAISEKVGQLEGSRLLEIRPILRHNNRIRSIHASLKIEANSLSLDEVRGVLNGRAVMGPASEIQEVKNAFAAYEQIGAFDPCRLRDLLRLHGVITAGVVDESGMFRTGNEGVFNGDRCIFVAPPPERVPVLMEDLFACEGGNRCAADQIMYNLGTRGIEYDLLPWLKAKGVLPMSYSTLRSSQLDTRQVVAGTPLVRRLCKELSVSPSALMLAFALRNRDICALFASRQERHIRDNLAEAERIPASVLAELDAAFPAPEGRTPLAKL